MTILSEVIVYIWLLPLVLFIVIPLMVQLFHLIFRLTHTIQTGQQQVEDAAVSPVAAANQ